MIEIMREWFTVNRPLVWFIYGQAFFILGLAIALRSRQYSRLNLAHSLPWLAGFGFLHGLNEWGDLFIPIQSTFLRESIVLFLQEVQLLVLAVSFAFLFQFGIELFRPFPERWRWVRFLPFIVLGLWLIFPFWMGFAFSHGSDQWRDVANVIARYALCIPGGWIAAFGLLRQAHVQIEPLGLPRISRMLKIAAGALIAYSILGGMIVPQSSFFPANLININSFTNLFVAPPPVFRSMAGIILAYAIIRAQDVFDIETDRLIRHMEESQVIAIERERIARDLHDGALQQVYAAGLLAQSLRQQAKGALVGRIDRLVFTINQAIDQLRAFLPQLQPEVETIDLKTALEPIIEEVRLTTPIQTFWETPVSPALSPEQVSHLVAFTREALSNAVRHAQTSKIELRLHCEEGQLRLVIRDFGSGIASLDESGYGMRNMRDRARLLGASLRFDTSPGKGTSVILDLPVEERDGTHTPADC